MRRPPEKAVESREFNTIRFHRFYRVRRFPKVFFNSGYLLSLKSDPEEGQTIEFWDSFATVQPAK
jgi:hypothetical protein